MTAPAEGSRVLRSRVPDPENESRGTIQRFFLAAAFFAGAFFAFFAGAFFAALAIVFLLVSRSTRISSGTKKYAHNWRAC